MKRFIAVLLLACCLLTACGKKPSAPEKLSVGLENRAAVISWAQSDEAHTYRLYRLGPQDDEYKFIFDSDGEETDPKVHIHDNNTSDKGVGNIQLLCISK